MPEDNDNLDPNGAMSQEVMQRVMQLLTTSMSQTPPATTPSGQHWEDVDDEAKYDEAVEQAVFGVKAQELLQQAASQSQPTATPSLSKGERAAQKSRSSSIFDDLKEKLDAIHSAPRYESLEMETEREWSSRQLEDWADVQSEQRRHTSEATWKAEKPSKGWSWSGPNWSESLKRASSQSADDDGPDLSEAARMEQAADAEPLPPGAKREWQPGQRGFWQRLKAASGEYGWTTNEAPLSRDEQITTGAQLYAAGDLGKLAVRAGTSAIGGAADVLADKATGGVLKDVAGTALSGMSNIAQGAKMGAAFGPEGMAIGAVVAASGTIATLPAKIIEWSDALVESRRDLAKWNGRLQAFFRMQERQQLMRDIDSARETSGSTMLLGETLQDIYDELRPIKDDMYNVSAMVATVAARYFQDTIRMFDLFSGTSKVISQIEKYMSAIFGIDKDQTNPNINKWAEAWRNNTNPSRRVPRR